MQWAGMTRLEKQWKPPARIEAARMGVQSGSHWEGVVGVRVGMSWKKHSREKD